MKSTGSHVMLEYYKAVVICLFIIYTNVSASKSNDDKHRSPYSYPNLPLTKGGWRPILSSDNPASYNFAGVVSSHSIGQKILTGPSMIETKVVSPHIVGVSPFTTEIFGNGILSTSTRPIVTRDANKLSSIAQSYKTTIYPQGSINLNAPVKGYMNPFSVPTGPGISTYKVSPGFQYDNMFMKHQPMLGHRPVYNKLPSHTTMMGKRLKHSPPQSHLYQQFPSNHYHQQIQTFQNSLKKPLDSYQRPKEIYPRPTENFSKYNTVIHHHQNYVNPQESLLTQTKSKHQLGQNVAAVTYKPPFSTHFQQFGIKEEPFGPIPSSILGSFSSFGHASIKAREPLNIIKESVSSTTTVKPLVSTEPFIAISSTAAVKTRKPTQEPKVSVNIKQHSSFQGIQEDFSKNLVPPPRFAHFTQNPPKPEVVSSLKGSFIPSPPDPLHKHQNPPEMLKPLKAKPTETKIYNTNLPTRRPEITSFFDTTLSYSTIDPFDAQSTKIVPENLLGQLPPPYTTPSPYNLQPVKIENNLKKENYNVYHGKAPTKYNTFDTNKYFSSGTGHDIFGSKFPKNTHEVNGKDVYKGSYEVTENWGSSGETNTQPTLHNWVGHVNSYKQLSTTGLKPPPPSFNVVSQHDDRIIPLPFSPTAPSDSDSNRYVDSSTIYSTIEDSNRNKGFFSQLENVLPDPVKGPVGDETFDLAAPVNISFTIDEKPRITTTPSYEEVTTQQQHVNTRRKPSRYRPHYESSTEGTVEEDFTTRFETYKEQTRGTENDLLVNELATIPPSKHFKRPVVTTTPATLDIWDETRQKKKNNKLRRRRPVFRASSTTEEVSEDSATEQPSRNHRFKTTTVPSNVEEVTKPIYRQKIRLPVYRSRLTTKPTSQPELTSSAQPTIIPTAPVTLRPRLHSRIRFTTVPSLDFDDLSETTTPRGLRQPVESNEQQSSIMKIAKDNHAHRSSTKKLHATLYETPKEIPDHSHKQDEKDTPTSDISVNTSDYKYSAQKLQNNEPAESVEASVSQLTSEEQTKPIEVSTDSTPFSSLEIENYPNVNIEASQTTRSEQFTELKSGNRGNTKSEKKISDATTAATSEDIITTTPNNSKKRIQLKSNKFESTRPRFSVKDYKNRLNQYSSTSTDKPTISSEASVARIRFPNRSRFPSFKDQLDNKAAASEISSSTEAPRKKFTPKDPRHRGTVNDDEPEVETPQENEVVPKPITKSRIGLRRDPNRARLPVVDETASNTTESAPQKSINTYANLKRPNSVNRKRIQIKSNSTEASEVASVETITTTTESVKEVSEEKNETSTEKYTSETAIMKIAKDERKHVNTEETTDSTTIDQSQRVSDLTLASSKEYNTPGLFKSISPNTRRVPNYFTIATDDPILPIEAFFPQLNQKKDT